MKTNNLTLRKNASVFAAMILALTTISQGSEMKNWRSNDWNTSTVRELVAFSTRADLKKTLGAPDENRGSTWVYSGVMVQNAEGVKTRHKLVIDFEGTNDDSKVTNVSLEETD